MDAQPELFRIENKRFEKYIRFFKVGAIISVAIVSIHVLLKLTVFDSDLKFVNLAGYAFAIGMYYEYRRKAKDWGGQFIEVTDSELSFKTRKNEQTTVQLNSITNIEIKLDQIILQTADLGEQTVVVEDFTEYSDRVTIKNNFAELKKKLSLTSASDADV